MNLFTKKNKAKETPVRVEKIKVETVTFGDMVVKLEITSYEEPSEKPGRSK